MTELLLFLLGIVLGTFVGLVVTASLSLSKKKPEGHEMTAQSIAPDQPSRDEKLR